VSRSVEVTHRGGSLRRAHVACASSVTCRVLVQPADECKRIHPGDLLLGVDGVDVTGKEALAVESMIMGPYGSPVGLTLESGHDKERRSVRLSRKEHVTDCLILELQVPVLEREQLQTVGR
jgi:C-terminal processing protease CtpA/Prc